MRLNRGLTFELAGGGFGLIAGLALGILRVANEPPPKLAEEALGNIAFSLLLLIPYLLALSSLLIPIKSRWIILLPSAILSLGSVGVSFTGAGIVFLPSVVMITLATVKSLGQRHAESWTRMVVTVSVALLSTAIVGGAVFTLFQNSNNPQTWNYTNYANGTKVWEMVPTTTPLGVLSRGPFGADVVSAGSIFYPDTINNRKALECLGMLAIASVSFFALGLYAKRNDHHPSISQPPPP